MLPPLLAALLLALAAAADACAGAGSFPMDKNYRAVGSQIEISNSGRFFNRPLYGEANGLVVFGGDRPLVRSGCDGFFQGTLMVALQRDGECGGWAHLDPAATTVAGYRPGISSWRHSSPRLQGVEMNLTVAPTDGGKGLAVRVAVSGGVVQAGDELLWLYSGVSSGYQGNERDPCVTTNNDASGGGSPGPRTDQLLDDRGNIKMMQVGFVANQSSGNRANVSGNRFSVASADRKHGITVEGATSAGSGSVRVVRFDPHGTDWQNASRLLRPAPPLPSPGGSDDEAEAVGGSIGLKPGEEIFFAFENNPSTERRAETPRETYEAAAARAERIRLRVQLDTPDAYINAGIPCAGAAVDGLWRDSPPVYVHGAMAWDVPLLGWRSEYGGTIWGQPERVAQEGAYWLARQSTADPPGHNRSACKADSSKHLATQDPDSRFYGVGSISTRHYDMQSQFFEQQVHMWRWTGNRTHEGLLRPGRELHATWAQESFDADQNGLCK